VKLAPVAPPPIPTAADKLPVAKLKAPQGFKVEVFAAGVANARSIRIGDKGTVFVSSRLLDKVHAIREKDGKREVKVIASGLHRPNGLAFHKGTLYVAELSKVSKLENIEDHLDDPPKLTLINDQFPKDEPHGWKFIAIGPDDKLYVPVGAPGNINNPDQNNYAHIRRMNLDGSGMEVVVRGVRNTVGFDWHPQTKELWFTDHNRDWAGDDSPNDELNRVPANQIGANFGFPYCHANGVADPDIKRPNPCAGVIMPAALTGPHSAACGLRFYTGNMFPADYKNQAFIARRGSWNRTKKLGYDVVLAKVNGAKATLTPFMTGFLDPATDAHWGRPVDVQLLADGSLLVSDEHNGAIYRVSYSGRVAATK
jgi:glucose/arabinose dehydrogenase